MQYFVYFVNLSSKSLAKLPFVIKTSKDYANFFIKMICILSIFQSLLHHFEHKYAPFQSASIHFVTEHKKDGSIRTLIQENFWGISI